MATHPVTQIVPLELLRSCERGVVHDVSGDEEVVHRLEEMGLRPGVALTMIQSGQPCIVCLGDQRLTFRIEKSLQILVEVHH